MLAVLLAVASLRLELNAVRLSESVAYSWCHASLEVFELERGRGLLFLGSRAEAVEKACLANGLDDIVEGVHLQREVLHFHGFQ